jgi:hypothetical protein
VGGFVAAAAATPVLAIPTGDCILQAFFFEIRQKRTTSKHTVRSVLSKPYRQQSDGFHAVPTDAQQHIDLNTC